MHMEKPRLAFRGIYISIWWELRREDVGIKQYEVSDPLTFSLVSWQKQTSIIRESELSMFVIRIVSEVIFGEKEKRSREIVNRSNLVLRCA